MRMILSGLSLVSLSPFLSLSLSLSLSLISLLCLLTSTYVRVCVRVVCLPFVLQSDSASGLLGRAHENQQMLQALRAVCSGSFRSLMLDGPPGIGKTALIDHFCHECESLMRPDKPRHQPATQPSADKSPTSLSGPLSMTAALQAPLSSAALSAPLSKKEARKAKRASKRKSRRGPLSVSKTMPTYEQEMMMMMMMCE